MFRWCDTVSRPKHYTILQINTYNCDQDIGEIVEPVYPQIISWQEKAISNILNEEAVVDVFGGVLIYIVIMLIGAIFQARLLIWLFGTAIFVLWLLNQYRT